MKKDAKDAKGKKDAKEKKSATDDAKNTKGNSVKADAEKKGQKDTNKKDT